MNNTLEIGDQVFWRGGFGADKVRMATVIGIEVTNVEKYGDDVEEVLWEEVHGRNVVVDLDNNHWAYAEQIKRIR